MRKWVWGVYVVLFAASIPWYLPGGAPRVVMGVPHWVLTSLAATVAIALFTTVVVRRYWDDDGR